VLNLLGNRKSGELACRRQGVPCLEGAECGATSALSFPSGDSNNFSRIFSTNSIEKNINAFLNRKSGLFE
jgi:hypothetical protein